jgi:hypothetical protein
MPTLSVIVGSRGELRSCDTRILLSRQLTGFEASFFHISQVLQSVIEGFGMKADKPEGLHNNSCRVSYGNLVVLDTSDACTRDLHRLQPQFALAA